VNAADDLAVAQHVVIVRLCRCAEDQVIYPAVFFDRPAASVLLSRAKELFADGDRAGEPIAHQLADGDGKTPASLGLAAVRKFSIRLESARSKAAVRATLSRKSEASFATSEKSNRRHCHFRNFRKGLA